MVMNLVIFKVRDIIIINTSQVGTVDPPKQESAVTVARQIDLAAIWTDDDIARWSVEYICVR